MTKAVLKFSKKTITLLFGLLLFMFGLSVFKFRLLNDILSSVFGITIQIGKLNVLTLYVLLFMAFLGIIFEINTLNRRKREVYEYFVPFILIFVVSIFFYFLLAFVYILVYSIDLETEINFNIGIFQFLSLFFGLHFITKPFNVFKKLANSMIEQPHHLRDFYHLKKGLLKRK